jgi:hypothetical protein
MRHASPRRRFVKLTSIPGVPDRMDVVPGTAHFSGTGPIGTTCGQCSHHGVSSKTRALNGCAKYLTMTRDYPPPPVEAKTPSCRHFLDKAKGLV